MSDMKKYISPSTTVFEVNCGEMIALSVQDGSADGSEVLSNDRGWNSEEWFGNDIWGEGKE